MNKTPNQIRADALAKAEKEIAKGMMRARIANALPVAPNFIHIYPLHKSIASVSYAVNTKAEALELYKKFAVSPSYICRGNGFVSVKCFDDEAADSVEEVHATLVCDQFRAKLQFFTQNAEETIRVDIELPLRLFGRYAKDRPQAVKHYKLEWKPLPKTSEMFPAIRYSAGENFGPHSAGQRVYAIYDGFEMENQFGE